MKRFAVKGFARTCALIVPLLALLTGPEASAQLQDAKGSKDHPMVSRYAGSIIIGYDARKFDELDLPLGQLERPEGTGTDMAPSKSQRIEGRLTRILYVAPETGRPAGQMSENAFSFPKDQRYLAAKLTRPEGDVYASVYVATETFDHYPETHGRALVLLDVIETVPMETGMVTVDAAAMAKDIAATGRVALYGIYFDTDKADLKPESGPTLQEIAELLKQDPALKVYVVGHTDNVGGFDYNMRLSQRRAASVVDNLTTKHGIQPARLKAAAVGLLAPVAPNDTEEGRAKNRRVELVKQ